MTKDCPECGTENCEDRLHRFLALEYTDARYGAVHHLTVAAYMLQHPSRLSTDGWLVMRQTLTDFLIHGQDPVERIRRLNKLMDSGTRAWSLSKGPSMPLPAGFRWSQTVAGVDATDPAQYRSDVEAWARGVLTDAGTI